VKSVSSHGGQSLFELSDVLLVVLPRDLGDSQLVIAALYGGSFVPFAYGAVVILFNESSLRGGLSGQTHPVLGGRRLPATAWRRHAYTAGLLSLPEAPLGPP
jgi:hypothetical protein